MRDFLCLGTDAPVAITYLQVNGQTRPPATQEHPVRIFFQSAQHSPEPANIKASVHELCVSRPWQ